jgi:hypothetical protein
LQIGSRRVGARIVVFAKPQRFAKEAMQLFQTDIGRQMEEN